MNKIPKNENENPIVLAPIWLLLFIAKVFY